jgi:putative nucleotidyltransferase with HDIG domain
MTASASPAKAREPIELPWDPERLPPFPAIALKALKLMSGTDSSLIDLCNLIRSDAAFSVAVLRVANSPLVAFSKNVTSVLQASMLLGFQRLRSVVITFGLRFYVREAFTPLMQSCWRHSVACAILAERAARWGFMDKDFAYTAGIFHDIGKVALATTMPKTYALVIDPNSDRTRESVVQPADLLLRERELCGIDHCEAGRLLLEAWDLPPALTSIVACHHEQETPASGTSALLLPSCEMSALFGFAAPGANPLRSYELILADFPEVARGHFPMDRAELASEIATEIKALESA